MINVKCVLISFNVLLLLLLAAKMEMRLAELVIPDITMINWFLISV